ncbi:beta-1,4-galactosyltransferase 4-like isoform X1 [Haliotis rufescens]|uniref:beta-1,4-galactosyltransferase 4-like isoform X1 n=1 Tax=Haliotis rufescens TaxID=6454 RepID=UPI00201F0679|nr:beta-1,4-galactosyltransferase 4-like isoform X1 [Haliotis rufescens]XP_046361221.2 beta-1,4-galactosyltransferase 4-like isoform X1 [Haliotis rufescens]XP_046361222.2 beta-1,4-galactosyltransferase 4-like isoform X1 [Haliotis rufescens]XP_048253780.1 beta-1,4-galactosyltransferase 4-like isoform X1 [Haliotis rufescens]
MTAFSGFVKRSFLGTLIIGLVFTGGILFTGKLDQLLSLRNITAQTVNTTQYYLTTTQTPVNKKSLPECQETPPGINEPVKLNLTNITLDELQRKYPSHSGERYRPEGCRSRVRLAVVIPYRDREQHLVILLNNIIPFLNKQQADFTIYVAEQMHGGIFNRGLMINAGVAAALKADNFTCIVIHDVDLIPETSDNYYRCQENPLHLSTASAKYGYKLPYASYAGGNIAISPSQFKRINGFSNWYFGWGGEDDDFEIRVKTVGMRLKRNPKRQGRYYAIKHERDKLNPENPKKSLLFKSIRSRMKTEGLSSLHCNTTVSHHGIVTWLNIAIDKQYYDSTIKY